jgi:NAD(P)-dependent dehydrogenase (short-subunit alcohol dehydrogenase family)
VNQAGADTMNPHNGRTYAVTGAASGIGAATARYLQERGGRVIACDLGGADVVGDLTTTDGRAAVADGVARLAGGKIDAIVANAGGGPPETMLALNFFGPVATLKGLRPLLKASPAPRAVVTSSISSFARLIRCSSKPVWPATNARRPPPLDARSPRASRLFLFTAAPSMR